MKTTNNRTRAQKERRRTMIKGFLAGAGLALGIWVMLSWIDIAFNNCDPEPVYQVWNLFAMNLPF